MFSLGQLSELEFRTTHVIVQMCAVVVDARQKNMEIWQVIHDVAIDLAPDLGGY